MLSKRQVGEAIARYRRSLNLTQDELAEKAGLSQASICQYETGKRYPDWRSLVRLRAIGFPVEKVLL